MAEQPPRQYACTQGHRRAERQGRRVECSRHVNVREQAESMLPSRAALYLTKLSSSWSICWSVLISTLALTL